MFRPTQVKRKEKRNIGDITKLKPDARQTEKKERKKGKTRDRSSTS